MFIILCLGYFELQLSEVKHKKWPTSLRFTFKSDFILFNDAELHIAMRTLNTVSFALNELK